MWLPGSPRHGPVKRDAEIERDRQTDRQTERETERRTDHDTGQRYTRSTAGHCQNIVMSDMSEFVTESLLHNAHCILTSVTTTTTRRLPLHTDIKCVVGTSDTRID